MNDLLQNLKAEFQDEDYRYGYAESFLNTRLAAQIKTLREQRGMTQAEVAAAMKIKQPGFRRFEDINHSVWKTDSLWNIARALGVRLNISFEAFGTLPEEKKHLNKGSLQRPKFEDDRAFMEISWDVATNSLAASRSGDDLSRLGNSMEAANKVAAYAAQRSQEYSEALAPASSYQPSREAAALSPKGHSRRHRARFKASLRSLKVVSISKKRPKRNRIGSVGSRSVLVTSYRPGIGNIRGQYETPKAS
jgi:transcriptional regulator with XRE-family HTH domain